MNAAQTKMLMLLKELAEKRGMTVDCHDLPGERVVFDFEMFPKERLLYWPHTMKWFDVKRDKRGKCKSAEEVLPMLLQNWRLT